MTKILHIQPQTTPLRGVITVPGDKSISHRAVMLAAIADGHSIIRDWLPAGDTLATLEAVKALGISVEIDKKSDTAWDLTIAGRGLHGLQPPPGPLDLRNAGTGIRLLAGIMAGQRFPVTLDGSDQLRKRPMRRITHPLRQMGAVIQANEGHAPLRISPADLRGFDFQMTVASAQVKSAVLLAGLYAAGITRIFEAGPSRDHTERMLTAMGADIAAGAAGLELRGGRPLRPLDLTVPSDISSAAFPIAAAAIVPHSQITLRHVGLNDTRTGILQMLQMMGANITLSNEQQSSGESVGDISVHFAEMHSTEIDGPLVVRGIDELPVWAVAATQAAGESTVREAAELRVKEVDRISVLAGELSKMGVAMHEYPDGFAVTGPLRLHGAVVDSHDDHRLGMSLAVAGLAARGVTTVVDAGCIADSFPGFVETMQTLGARMRWE